ncbi:ABC transporter substrate-binding protein [Pseudogracilibacillus sp. SO30301A]|uniref:ABC transporter substrate-binding protein n=1 Tax=Pseudogracilibacillus sp. SO30301A TaxID=3098291 RepID=UPI00300E0E2A
MKKFWIVILAALILLVGCMEKKENSKENNSKENETSTSQKIEIQDADGVKTFDGPQERVVALEWSLVEELLIAGVQPVGVADIENFNKWVTIEAELDDSVVDVGDRLEPNMEEIGKLKPDVILAIKGRHEAIKSELEKIAPVVMYDNLSDDAISNQYDHALQTLRETGKLVGKEEAVETAIQSLETKFKEANKQLEELNLETKDFIFTQAYSVNQAPTFRIFTTNSIVSHVLENIGLTNKVVDDPDSSSGFIETNVEGLVNYQEAMLIHTVQEDDPLFDNLKNNEAWNGLYFVKNNEMYDVGGGVWTFGSVQSMETLLDQVLSSFK